MTIIRVLVTYLMVVHASIYADSAYPNSPRGMSASRNGPNSANVQPDAFNPADPPAIQSPDFAETAVPEKYFGPVAKSFGNTAASAQQQRGALSGKIVFMNSGHGWTWDSAFTPPWRLQRPVLLSMNEDYGNLDQLNFFAAYCFNAGATVVSMRPLGHQTNEVILDNTSAGVTWAGTWSDSTSTIFWGAPGALPYRFASLAATETATATYTPTIPVAGYYPVYCWTRHGSDRGDQLYRIRHTGGESQIRIPHHMVGNGWIFLGEYYFNAGANVNIGSVVISNLRGTPTGTVVIADAIRFGNGMGTVDQGGGVSGYPREDENMRYWVKANLGQGQLTSLYEGSGDDESDSWSAPGKMSAEMNREAAGTTNDRIHISFHSNASTGNTNTATSRGAVGLITGTSTENQALLAQICGQEVNVNLRSLNSQLEFPWSTRTTYTFSGGYGEITRTYFNSEMDATIIEVAYHDNVQDAPLMRDPKVRSAIAKSALHAVIKFLNQISVSSPPPLAFLPEPPSNVRALAASTGGNVAISWSAPVNLIGSQNPTNYIIYRSTNGYGFGNPISVGNVTSFTVTGLPPNSDFYFRVSAVNAGGESMPSEVVGCRVSSTNGAPKVLVVNGFDRFDRTTDLKQNVVAGTWDRPGNSGSIERVFQRWINGFDYVVQHGKAIANFGMAFDSCQNEAIINNQVTLSNYPIVIWACGNETTNSETFSSSEQTKIVSSLAGGGNLFVSGADVAFDLDRPSGPTSADRTFLHNQLHAAFANDNSTSYTATAQAGGIFAGRSSTTIDNGNFGTYWVQTPDVLSPLGPGASVALNYSGGTGGAAAIQYDGSAGGGRTVLFGFPFEAMRDGTRRNQLMSDILTFLRSSRTQMLFLDNFDSDSAANWVLNSSSPNCRATFNYDYAADGIPSAPNSTNGTTRGLKLEANISAGVIAAINLSPVGQIFGGDYRLRFDLWMNQNGPFPAGGVGSTQHGTAGIGTAGNHVQWTNAASAADGVWFAADGEGQATDAPATASLSDFEVFRGTSRQAATSGVFAAGTASNSRGNGNAYYATTFPGGQTAPALQSATWPQQTGGLAVGTIGFGWRDVVINKSGNTVDWTINGLKIATIANANLTSSNIFVGLWDAFASVSDNTNLSFALFDNVRVERVTNPLGQYVGDDTPFQFVSAIVTDSNQIKLTLSGPAGAQVTISSSDDLVSWVNITNIVIGDGPIEFTEDIEFTVPQRFYRAERSP
jgi:Fibronectin type III domain